MMQGPCRPTTIAAIFLLAFAAGCGETGLTPPPHPSAHLTAQDTNNLAGRTNILTQLGIGVATSKIGAPSRTRFSASVNGRQVAATVIYGKTLQSATAFTADYIATKSSPSPGRKKVRAGGNVLIASLGPAVQLTSSTTKPGSATTLQFSGQTESVTLAAATTGNGVIFSVGSGDGGTVQVIGNQVIFKDDQGFPIGQHTFDSGDEIEKNVDEVINADVPPPSPRVVAALCASENAISVSNSKIFQVDISQEESSQSHSSRDLFQILATKTAEVDCKTGAATTRTLVGVVGEHGDQDFQAISISPPSNRTAQASDTTAALSTPDETTSTVRPSDVDMLPPQVPVSGRGKAATAQSFDGSYSGTISGSYVNSHGHWTPSGAFAFTVSNGVMTVTAPGSGSGHVSASGSADVSTNNATLGVGGLSVSGLGVEFTGQFSVSGTTKVAIGGWKCSGPDGGTGSGSWIATAR
jgi:hypothetical protein